MSVFANYRPSRFGAALFVSLLLHLLVLVIISREGASLISAGGTASWLQVRIVRMQQPRGPSAESDLEATGLVATASTGLSGLSDEKKSTQVEQQIQDISQIEQNRTKAMSNPGQSKDIVIDIETGARFPEQDLADVKFESPPIRFVIKINPAGFVDDWKAESELPELFSDHPEYLNTLIRNMKFERKGETYFVEWLGYIDRKDHFWLAKLKVRYEHQ